MRKFLQGFRHAISGIASAIRTEGNLRFHLVAAVAVVLLSAYFGLSSIEWAVVVLCIGLVIAAELINTSIEKLSDVVSPEIHPLIKKVKDISAGAVLTIAVAAAIVGILIFYPRLLG